MPLYKLTLAYDGTRYVGWQVQPNGLAIQQLVQEKIEILLKRPTPLTGSGRTDAGVHALAQTAHFPTDNPLDLHRFSYALNALLPPDIRALSVEEVPSTFHARYSAKGKVYTYHLLLAPLPNPFRRLYNWHLPYTNFSLDLVAKGAEKLLGTHDFKGFAHEAHRSVASYDSTRTLRRLDITEWQNETVLLFEADGFLYKMVRNLVGTLVDIGRGHIPLDTLDDILTSKDRRLAGQTAPAHALFLKEVIY